MVKQTFNKFGKDKTYQIQKKLDNACNVIQNKCNELTKSIDDQVHKNSIPMPDLYNDQQSSLPPQRSSLFPNVDLASIGRPSHPVPKTEDASDLQLKTESPPVCRDNEYQYENQLQWVNTKTFYELRRSKKCTNEVDILSFYKALQHMASTCCVPMRDLDNIDEHNGVCPMIP